MPRKLGKQRMPKCKECKGERTQKVTKGFKIAEGAQFQRM